MPCKFPSLSYRCVIFTINLAEQRHVGEWGRDGVMFMCAHVYDVALCGSTVRNVALGLWLVGRPWTTCFALLEWFVWADFHEISIDDVIVLIQLWYNFFASGHICVFAADTKSIVQTHTFCTTLLNKNRQNRTFCNSVGGWITDVMRNF